MDDGDKASQILFCISAFASPLAYMMNLIYQIVNRRCMYCDSSGKLTISYFIDTMAWGRFCAGRAKA